MRHMQISAKLKSALEATDRVTPLLQRSNQKGASLNRKGETLREYAASVGQKPSEARAAWLVRA